MGNVRKTIGRDTPDGGYIEISAELRRDDPRGISDGFSITASQWHRRSNMGGRAAKRNGREPDAGGCLHDEILTAAPELAAIVAVHLADPAGVPMHAEANGWYFYRSGRPGDCDPMAYHGDREGAARALHIRPELVPAKMTRETFARFVASLRRVWRAQAAAALLTLGELEDGDGVEAPLYDTANFTAASGASAKGLEARRRRELADQIRMLGRGHRDPLAFFAPALVGGEEPCAIGTVAAIETDGVRLRGTAPDGGGTFIPWSGLDRVERAPR